MNNPPTYEELILIETKSAIAALREYQKDIKRRRAEVRREFKGTRPISCMNRTTPRIERGQAFRRALDNLELEEYGIARQLKQLLATLQPPTP